MGDDIILAVKCAPTPDLLDAVRDAGVSAVELWLNEDLLRDGDAVAALCGRYPFRYALHAPTQSHAPSALRRLADAVAATVVVQHASLWEDEWREFAEAFRGARARVCVENIASIHEPVPMQRRFGMGRCLDLEHVQLDLAGLFAGPLGRVMRGSEHVHLTGYVHGSELWHTPIDRSPEHNRRLLDMLRSSGYRGMVVSEAEAEYQNREDFRKVREFFAAWAAGAQGDLGRPA